MIGLNFFLYFQKLIFFPSFLSLMIPQGIFFTNFSFRENWRNWRFKDLYSFAFTSLRDLKNFSNTFIYNLKGVTGYVRKLNWVCMLWKASFGFIWNILYVLKICKSWVCAQIRCSKLLLWGWIRFQN